jgi:hypothetical protein
MPSPYVLKAEVRTIEEVASGERVLFNRGAEGSEVAPEQR